MKAGVTSQGSTSYPEYTIGTSSTETNALSTNWAYGVKYTHAAHVGVLTKMKFYTAGSTEVKVNFYSHDAGNDKPDSPLITTHTETISAGGYPAWCEATLAEANRFSLVASTIYWIALQFNTGSTLYYGPDGVYRRSYINGSWNYGDDWGDPWAAGSNEDTNDPAECQWVYVKTKGYIHGTKVTPAWSSDNGYPLNNMYFYSEGSGNVRLGIYDNSSPNALIWESDSEAVTEGWNTITISDGTPIDVHLVGGTVYWLCWQTDSELDIGSYTAGGSNTGFIFEQAYGAYPSTIADTFNTETWSQYVDTVDYPVRLRI